VPRKLFEALSDVRVRAARPRDKAYKLSDGRGLYLLVTPNGSRLWRLKYRLGGRERLLSLGPYPDISLKQARAKAIEARGLVLERVDPVHERRERDAKQLLQAGQTFASVAQEWIAKKLPKWTEDHAEQTRQSLRDYVLPVIGNRPIANLTAQDVRRVLDPMERAGKAETLRRVRQRINAVFGYAVLMGMRTDNPIREMGSAYSAPVREHFASITAQELPAFLASLHRYQGHTSTKSLIRMILMTACRTGEVRGAVWDEFDLEAARWTIPAHRMKKRRAHVVPLPRQAVEMLKTLAQDRQGSFVFPSPGRPDTMASENIVLQALGKMGYGGRLSGHGLRAAVATALEEMNYPTEVIKAQLSHARESLTDAAYLRGLHLETRATMMQTWADRLDQMSKQGRAAADDVDGQAPSCAGPIGPAAAKTRRSQKA
jgi:integrase